MKINRVYIEVHTEKNKFLFDECFSGGLNIITSYENTVGKSTIGEAILFCLGMEEVLGFKNEKAVKPVLRSNISINKGGESYPVIQSDIYVEVEQDGNIISIRRSPKHNSRSSKLISVYESELCNALQHKVDCTDYYVHDPGSAVNMRGFHAMLTRFLGLELPEVSDYDGGSTILYIQTLASCFYIEQKQGWRGILATLPTYYGIKDVKRRVVEYVLGLSVFQTEKEYNTQKAIINNLNSEWNQIIGKISYQIRKINGLAITNVEDKPFVITDEAPELTINVNDEVMDLMEYKDRVLNDLSKLMSCKEPIIENQSKALKREIEELNKLDVRFQRELNDSLFEVSIEKEQLDTINNRLANINQEMTSYKELYKLKNMGSLEVLKISQSICPTCGQSIDGVIFDQDAELNIMSISDSITHLDNERKMLEFSLNNQKEIVDNLKSRNEKLNERLDEIRARIRIVKSDLVSNNKSVSESYIQKIIALQIESEKLKDIICDIEGSYNQLKTISKKWVHAKSELEKLPTNFVNEHDKTVLSKFKKEFTKILGLIKFESIEINNITINEHSYLPNVSGFDLYADSSASDTIRIIWAYIVALQKISLEYGHNLGFLLMDEPAQQNTDLSSSRQLLNQLRELAKKQQVFMLYKLESEESDTELFKGIDSKEYVRFHSDVPFISAFGGDTKEQV